jgi:hypothetical protein
MLDFSMSSAVNALMLIGTLCSVSCRRCAVTTISLSSSVPRFAAGSAAASACTNAGGNRRSTPISGRTFCTSFSPLLIFTIAFDIRAAAARIQPYVSSARRSLTTESF